jgi:hypothetical protein
VQLEPILETPFWATSLKSRRQYLRSEDEKGGPISKTGDGRFCVLSNLIGDISPMRRVDNGKGFE